METTNKKPQFEIAEIQLSYKSRVKPSLHPKITSSKEAYDILLENWDENKIEFIEQFKIILLNRANRVWGIFGQIHDSLAWEELASLLPGKDTGPGAPKWFDAKGMLVK